MRSLTSIRVVLAVVAFASLAAACNHDSTPTPPTLGVDVALSEWAVTDVGDGRVNTGAGVTTTFKVRNDGEVFHRLAVWKGGSVVGDTVEGGELVGETEILDQGAEVELAVSLEPGTYLLTCPIAGHTGLGMHTELIVSGP